MYNHVQSASLHHRLPSQPDASWIAFQKSCPPHSAAATPQALRKSSAMDKDGSWRRTCVCVREIHDDMIRYDIDIDLDMDYQIMYMMI